MPKYFQAMPEVPTGVTPGVSAFNAAIKQNIELLCGMRDAAHASVVHGDVLTAPPDTPTYNGVDYYTSGGAKVPTFEDYQKLVLQVNSLNVALTDLIRRIS